MAAAFLLVSPPGWSAPDDAEAKKRLKGVERALKKDRKNQRALKRKADALQKEMRDLGRQLVTAAAALQNHEAKVSEFEVGLERLRREEEWRSSASEQLEDINRHAEKGRVQQNTGEGEEGRWPPFSPLTVLRTPKILDGRSHPT